jgi:hypothetical protein
MTTLLSWYLTVLALAVLLDAGVILLWHHLRRRRARRSGEPGAAPEPGDASPAPQPRAQRAGRRWLWQRFWDRHRAKPPSDMLSVPRRPNVTAAWILLALAVTLAMSAQAQFDQNRLAQKWDAWQRPSLVAVVGATLCGLVLRQVALERPAPGANRPTVAWGRVLPPLIGGFALTLASADWFRDNTIRPLGLVAWLAGIGLVLWTLRTDAPGGDKGLSMKSPIFSHGGLCISWEWVSLIAIVCLGAFFRLYRLDDVPAELTLDQISKFWDIRNVLSGSDASIFFTANQGREGLFFYLAALVSQFIGLSQYTLKLTSALAGIAAVPAMYLLARELADCEVGLYAAFLLAISKWHVILSRLGYRVSLLPLFVILAMYYLARGLRRGRLLDYGLAGVALGLGMYTYKSFPSVFPAALSCIALYSWQRRDRRPVLEAAIVLLLALMVYVPLGLFAIESWDAYVYREVLQVGLVRESYGAADLSAVGGLLINLRKGALMFNFVGGVIELYNVPSERFFNQFNATLFILGIGYILARWKKGHNAIPLLFLGWATLPLVVSMCSPKEQVHTFRAAGSIGPGLFIVALVLAALRRFFANNLPSRLRSVQFTLSPADATAQPSWQRHFTLDVMLLVIAALGLLFWMEVQTNYETVFYAYPQHLRYQNYPLARSMAEEIDHFLDMDVGPVFVKYLPSGTEAGLIEVYLTSWGWDTWHPNPDHPMATGGYQVQTLAIDEPPLDQNIPTATFLVYPEDLQSLEVLRNHYPQHLVYPRYRYDGQPAYTVFVGHQ